MKTNYRPHNGLLETFGIVNSKEYPKSCLPLTELQHQTATKYEPIAMERYQPTIKTANHNPRYSWKKTDAYIFVFDTKPKEDLLFATIQKNKSEINIRFGYDQFKKIQSIEEGELIIKEKIKSDPDLAINNYNKMMTV